MENTDGLYVTDWDISEHTIQQRYFNETLKCNFT